VSRWEPGAEQRLQGAALTLFLEHGYENVTVAEIARAAGLTRRTFFNHFADKREIFFGGAAAFRSSVVEHLDQADPDLSPVQAALAALTAAGRGIAAYREYAPTVRRVIASSSELQERDLSKLASITTALTEGLEQRGVPGRAASFAARAAVTAYSTAWEDWVAHPDEDFGELMQQALADLRAAVDGG
jgi:AcrR family transcriptional regulator